MSVGVAHRIARVGGRAPVGLVGSPVQAVRGACSGT